MHGLKNFDYRNSTQTATLFGVVFIAVAVLGFIPNPLVSPTGLFAVNTAHNILHAIVGVALLAAAKTGYAKKALLVFGIIYVLVAMLGYMTMGDLLGIVRVNMPDHYLHLLLGIVLIVVGVKAAEPVKKK